VAISPDGKTVGSVGKSAALRLWDTATGRHLRDLAPIHTSSDTFVPLKPSKVRIHSMGTVNALAFSPDGVLVAAGGSEGRVALWRKETGGLIFSAVVHKGEILAVAFGPDSKTLVSAGEDGVVRLWDTSIPRPVRSFKGHQGAVRAVAFSPDGKILATGGDDRLVQLWDPATGKALANHKTHTDAVTSLAFSPDGQILASGGRERRALLCPLTPAQLQSLEFRGPVQIPAILCPGPVLALAFPPGNKQIILAGDSFLGRFDLTNGQLLTSYPGNEWEVCSVAVSPDGSTVVAGGAEGVIRRWLLASGQELVPPGPVGHSGLVVGMAVAPGGRHLATVGVEGTLQLWAARSGQRLWTARPTWRDAYRGVLWSTTFVPPGGQVAGGGYDGVIRVWDTSTGKLVREWLAHPDTPRIGALACSSDGRVLASAGVEYSKVLRSAGATGEVFLWNPATGKRIGVCAGAPVVKQLLFVLGDTVLAGGAADGTIVLWDATSGERLHVLRGWQGPVATLAFGGNKTLVGGGGEEVHTWDLSGRHPTRLRRFEMDVEVAALACSPDGETLAMGSSTGRIALIHLATWQKTHFIEHMNRGPLTHLAFVSDGILASSAYDGVLLWKVPLERTKDSERRKDPERRKEEG
jgi:WD40 repeat protein